MSDLRLKPIGQIPKPPSIAAAERNTSAAAHLLPSAYAGAAAADLTSSVRVYSAREHNIAMLTANYGRLPENHVTSIYLNELSAKVNPGFEREVIVLPNFPDANALVTADNKTIFISQKLLNKMNCEEAIDWILKHEGVHIEEEHIQQSEEENGLINKFGLARVQEGRADFLGAYYTDQAEINPQGAIAALEAITPKSASADPIHGTSINRALNLLLAVPYLDLPHLSHHLTPLPDLIKNTGIRPPLSERVCKDPLKEIKPVIKSANVYQLRVMLEAIEAKLAGAKDSEKEKLINHKKILIERADELVKRELKRQKLDEDKAEIGLEMYLTILGVEKEQGNVFAARDCEWLADNYINLFLSGNMGFEPLSASNALAFCQRLAEFLCFSGIDERQIITVYHHACDRVREKLRDDTPPYLSNPLARTVLSAHDRIILTRLILDGAAIPDGAAIKKRVPDKLDFKKFFNNFIYADPDISGSMIHSLMGIANHYETGYPLPPPYTASEKEIEEYAGTLVNKIAATIAKKAEPLISGFIDRYCNQYSDNVKGEIRSIMLIGNIEGGSQRLDISIDVESFTLKEIEQLKEGFVGFEVFEVFEGLQVRLEIVPAKKRGREIFLHGLSRASAEELQKLAAALHLGNAFRHHLIDHLMSTDLDRLEEGSILGYNFNFEDVVLLDVLCDKEKYDFYARDEEYHVFLAANIKKYLAKKRVPLNEKIGLLKRIPSLRKGKLYFQIQTESEFYKAFIRNSLSEVKDIDDKLILSFLIPDPLERQRIQPRILLAHVQRLSFQDALQFIQEHSELDETVLGPALSYFCENLPHTHEEHEQAIAFIKKRAVERSKKTEAVAALAAIDAWGYEKFTSGEGLLLAGLASASDERSFKQYLYGEWIKRVNPKLESYSPFNKPAYIRGWQGDLDTIVDKDIDSIKKPSLAAVVDFFYSLDEIGREAVIRRCLVGKNGVLMDKESALKLVKGFLESRLDQSGHQDIRRIISEALDAFIETADIKEQYQLLSPLLRQNFLLPPSAAYAYTELARERAEEYVASKKSEYKKKLESDNKNAWASVQAYYQKLLEEQSPRLSELRPDIPKLDNVLKLICWKAIDEVSQKLLKLMLGRVVDFNRYEEEMKKAKEKGLDELFGVSAEKREVKERLDPVELILQAGQILLPVGVRFLQCLRQYIEIPEEYRPAFDEVFDSVMGQSRLSLYSTYKRESSRDDLNQSYYDGVAEIGERIGGGSLVSVYKTRMKENDEPGILKVINPNAIYRAEAAVKVVAGIVEHMAKRHPEHKQVYASVRMLLDDILDWIVRDVTDEKFYRNDALIAERYKDFPQIRIPEHRELSGPYLRAEEYVEGHNLTQIRIKGEEECEGCRVISRAEYKNIISLYAQLYLNMVMSGIALSNLTPGNLRVTPDNKLAILDRNLYLEFDEEDRKLFSKLFTSFNNPSAMAEAIADYLAGLPQNQELAGEKRILEENLTGLLKEETDWEIALFRIMAEVKARGFKVPLKITLHIMNIKVLNNLSAKAGFNSLLECLAHRPDPGLLNF